MKVANLSGLEAVKRTCPRCLKPAPLCVCEDIAPLDNRIELFILQHPQEQDIELGTARLATLHFKKATLKIGLSWPSLAKLLGRLEARKQLQQLRFCARAMPEVVGDRPCEALGAVMQQRTQPD